VHTNCIQSARPDQRQIQVAVKTLKSQDIFEREYKCLRMIRELKSRHIIKYIATCERRTSYHILFPWAAGGSLLDYWSRNNDTPRTPELVLWSLRQMFGLSEALRALHQDLDGDMHCRHGDLKPDNILLFGENEDRYLVIADLGVSRIHEQPTDMRPGGTTTTATTRVYQAPEISASEARDKPRHRTYDVWSLGCIFLEFVIWLIHDAKAVKNFADHRFRRPQNVLRSFYQINNSTGQVEPDSAVENAISALKADSRCASDTALGTLVDFIAEKVLVIPVRSRCDATTLCDKVQAIVQTAEHDLKLGNASYLLKEHRLLAPAPKVFLPAEPSLKSRPDTPQA
jgi:serine/threonine protein kinase